MFRSVALVLLVLWSCALGAQEIDPPVASARLLGGVAHDGAFAAYAGGAADGTNYYLLTTNSVKSNAVTLPPGECRYFDVVNGAEIIIGEKVVAYEGANTYGNLQSANPVFSQLRVVSPCFDGRFGEPTEQKHRTVAYGNGTLVYSPAKSKYYLSVNRTRLQSSPCCNTSVQTCCSQFAHAMSNGFRWQAGDFDEVLLGAYGSAAVAFRRPTSSSTLCRGSLAPPASETCTPTMAWSWIPLVKITSDLVDPVDQAPKTFTALPPLLAAYDSSVESLPIFNGIGARGAVLFGFMEFGHICRQWEEKDPPYPAEPYVCPANMKGYPNRLAAVFVTDTGGIRPTGARLYFKRGSSWIAMNADGTFPSVPSDYSSQFPMSDWSDVRYSPVASQWRLWGTLGNTESSIGCAEVHAPTTGTSLGFYNLAQPTGYSVTSFWPSQNSYGRTMPHPNYVIAPACNCLREFVFYTTTDWACYFEPPYNEVEPDGKPRFSPFWGREVAVRRWLDGPPDQ